MFLSWESSACSRKLEFHSTKWQLLKDKVEWL